MSAPSSCPCRHGEPFDRCCGPVLAGQRQAATAEALMRSRYVAFAVGDADYLLRSWHSRTRPKRLSLDHGLRWRFLEIVRTERGGPFDDTGVVEFVAHYRTDEGRGELHEVSRFAREDGQWRYLDGDIED
ncbi:MULTISPECIES: YchJ family protein [Nocardia]|uniref:YchJ family protein n=1 Tax=Nocardia TaxID=1817 RepID=UPI000A3BA60C|nr:MULTISPECIES: YchJ family metal-binding protein [Nocardia]MBF6143427.1 hypothetical protein [Nocardia farcinica]MBF6189280.1 hypothetical protein [Nocardia farcinica]MBF6254551.1 hypothetical protein [Nocardia farcinica]MBF6259469.1 hypothetical protein [Nocardia farcinica]MBF6293657.1 hypothetical protein [Nocardia farcinica]